MTFAPFGKSAHDVQSWQLDCQQSLPRRDSISVKSTVLGSVVQ